MVYFDTVFTFTLGRLSPIFKNLSSPVAQLTAPQSAAIALNPIKIGG